jgi:hypothetical protein
MYSRLRIRRSTSTAEPIEAAVPLRAQPLASGRALRPIKPLVAVLVEVLDDLAILLRHAAHELAARATAGAKSV